MGSRNIFFKQKTAEKEKWSRKRKTDPRFFSLKKIQISNLQPI